MDVAKLAEILHETEDRHGQFEKTHAPHHWWDWYAAYLNARQSGQNPDEAERAAAAYMKDTLGILPR